LIATAGLPAAADVFLLIGSRDKASPQWRFFWGKNSWRRAAESRVHRVLFISVSGVATHDSSSVLFKGPSDGGV
jgi:hypothetical protein